jgi:sortase A
VTTALEQRPTSGGGARIRAGRPTAPLTGGLAVASTVLTIVALLLIAFVVEVTLLGSVRHARAQRVAFADLRVDLAEGTGPVGQTDLDGKLIDVGRPIALLSIPEIGVREVVLEGTSGSVLANGPGHRRDSPYPGQAGGVQILGRQAAYGGPFRRIAELSPGDEIAVTTAQGNHLYVVTDVREEGDTVTPLAAGEGRLTLTTAEGPLFLPDGVVRVDAKLATPVELAPAKTFGSSSLPPGEEAMAGDRSILLPLFLWSQFLLVVGVALVWVRSVWGRWQTWVVATPALALATLQVSHQLAQLLPNLT